MYVFMLISAINLSLKKKTAIAVNTVGTAGGAGLD
jgi:hypothetical protein